MPRILIENLFKTTILTGDQPETLLKHFQKNGIDWMHACGGKGRCTTCKVIIVEGPEHLGPLTPAEERYVKLGALRAGERLSCQARVTGDITVRVPREYQLPHMEYSDDEEPGEGHER